MDRLQRIFTLLFTLLVTSLPLQAQVEEGTWRGPDGAPPLIMVGLVGAAVVATVAVVLYALTVGRTPRHEDTRPA